MILVVNQSNIGLDCRCIKHQYKQAIYTVLFSLFSARRLYEHHRIPNRMNFTLSMPTKTGGLIPCHRLISVRFWTLSHMSHFYCSYFFHFFLFIIVLAQYGQPVFLRSWWEAHYVALHFCFSLYCYRYFRFINLPIFIYADEFKISRFIMCINAMFAGGCHTLRMTKFCIIKMVLTSIVYSLNLKRRSRLVLSFCKLPITGLLPLPGALVSSHVCSINPIDIHWHCGLLLLAVIVCHTRGFVAVIAFDVKPSIHQTPIYWQK